MNLIHSVDRKFVAGTMIFLILAGALAYCAQNNPTTLVFPPFGHCYGMRKGSERHLWMFLGDRTRFKNPQGLAAVKLKQNDKQGKKDDDELTVYGVNSGRHQIIYNKSLLSLAAYGKKGNKKGRFMNPEGIAANADGDVLVADTGNHRIVHLINRDNELHHLKYIGEKGEASGQFQNPSQVALTDENFLYVTDTGNNRVQIFDIDGTHLRSYPDPNHNLGLSFDSPEGIAVTTEKARWSRFHSAFFCVTDSGRARIRKIDMQGKTLATVVPADLPFDTVDFAYLAIDYYENIWVTDIANHTVHKFDRNLDYLASYGEKGSDDFQFDEPRGISIWRKFGQVFIAEKKSAQYYWIGIDLLDMTHKIEKDTLTVSYKLTETGRVHAAVMQADRSILTLAKDQLQTSGYQRLTASIDSLSTGDYTIAIKAKPTYSSRKYFVKEAQIPIHISTEK
ncbi:MAG: hypothetical protein B6244_11115 [Candidatus Cloacimonetes bacterium 4572_55]|nr:MAG: hypothetical protein B6244_11115 [Candidatus Cloacimonetes bacterium 4572_55]